MKSDLSLGHCYCPSRQCACPHGGCAAGQSSAQQHRFPEERLGHEFDLEVDLEEDSLSPGASVFDGALMFIGMSRLHQSPLFQDSSGSRRHVLGRAWAGIGDL